MNHLYLFFQVQTQVGDWQPATNSEGASDASDCGEGL